MPDFFVSVSDLQEVLRFDPGQVGELEERGASVLAEIQRQQLQRVALPQAVEVSLIDDEAIARVHAEFLDDPTPTDVITFPYEEYGEILISLETAQRQGEKYGRLFFVETTLYLIHGILHLAGYDDKDPAERKEMERIQEFLLTPYL